MKVKYNRNKIMHIGNREPLSSPRTLEFKATQYNGAAVESGKREGSTFSLNIYSVAFTPPR